MLISLGHHLIPWDFLTRLSCVNIEHVYSHSLHSFFLFVLLFSLLCLSVTLNKVMNVVLSLVHTLEGNSPFHSILGVACGLHQAVFPLLTETHLKWDATI